MPSAVASPPDAALWTALRAVQDPEYALSVVELGLIYGLASDDGRVTVHMTFTSIGCPAIEMLSEDVREALNGVEGVEDTRVEVVWHPPWTKDRISPRGRKVLAAYGVT